VVARNELGEFVVMRVKQLLELEYQTSALQRRGFAPSREGGFRSGDGRGDFSCVASGTRASTRPCAGSNTSLNRPLAPAAR
jgi:hypothetical protein